MNSRCRSDTVQDGAESLHELLLVERHHAEAFQSESVVAAAEVHVDDDVTWVVHSGSAWRNAGILLRFAPASATRRLNMLVKRYEPHARGMGLWVSPLATPHNITRLLAGHGLRCKKYFPAMVRSLNHSATEGADHRNITVERVLDVTPFKTTAHPAIGPITTPIR